MSLSDDDDLSLWVQDQLLEEEYEAAYQDVFAAWFAAPAERPNRAHRSPNINRERVSGDEQIMKDYFADHSIYTDAQFRRRFRMRRSLFQSIQARVVAQDPYFLQKSDAVGVLGLSSIQKITCALRMLASGTAADSLDEYIRIGESTALQCLHKFCNAIVEIYSGQYMRSPTVADVQRILSFNQDRSWPGMIGSIDCMHWEWKNCPRAWAGQFKSGRHKHPSIVLEAVASYDLWIWHAFFGMPRTMNDINVLDRSHIFVDQIQGVAPRATFQVNGKRYNQPYLLADGIYPKWSTFVQAIKEPQGEKRKNFTKAQESTRKDIERAFGVLQARWAIVREPARIWSQESVKQIMTACIILHNLIVEDERELGAFDALGLEEQQILVVRGGVQRDARLPSILVNSHVLRNEEKYHQLRADLIEHLWQFRGEN